MRVFKFGGASVKDAAAVRNVGEIVRLFEGEKLAIVVSAMGKTTNALEELTQALWDKDYERFMEILNERLRYHQDILSDLFPDEQHEIWTEVQREFDMLEMRFDGEASDNYHYEYDQIVSIGEVISTRIVNAWLQSLGMKSRWADARKLIRTNNTYREAEVDWAKTERFFQERFVPHFEQVDIQILQGFVGHTPEGLTTTLGREGSDFTAAIVAYCCNAQDVTIWKDVPGMLNADPKWFDNTIKLDSISFKEAIELSYYGASVIHPKTVKPLQNKQIPLYVKSFLDPHAEGTVIQESTSNDHLIPSFIFKMNQVLFSITPRDFSFLVEKHLSDIFDRLSKAGARINLMQNSALNFSVLLDEEKVNVEEIVQLFSDNYKVRYNTGLELVTIRHYDQETLNRVTVDKIVLLEQKTRETARLIVKQK